MTYEAGVEIRREYTEWRNADDRTALYVGVDDLFFRGREGSFTLDRPRGSAGKSSASSAGLISDAPLCRRSPLARLFSFFAASGIRILRRAALGPYLYMIEAPIYYYIKAGGVFLPLIARKIVAKTGDIHTWRFPLSLKSVCARCATPSIEPRMISEQRQESPGYLIWIYKYRKLYARSYHTPRANYPL